MIVGKEWKKERKMTSRRKTEEEEKSKPFIPPMNGFFNDGDPLQIARETLPRDLLTDSEPRILGSTWFLESRNAHIRQTTPTIDGSTCFYATSPAGGAATTSKEMPPGKPLGWFSRHFFPPHTSHFPLLLFFFFLSFSSFLFFLFLFS